MFDQIILLNSCIATDYRFCLDTDFSLNDLLDILDLSKLKRATRDQFMQIALPEIEQRYSRFNKDQKEELIKMALDEYQKESAQHNAHLPTTINRALKLYGLTIKRIGESFRLAPIESWESAKEKLIEAVENSDYVKRRHIEDRGANAMEFVLDNLNWKTR